MLILVNLPAFGSPVVFDRNYIVEEYVSGLHRPTSMAFLGDDMLVLEKVTGDIRLVRNGTLEESPILHVDVNAKNERGLLGITTTDSTVYLYYTASEGHHGKAIANQIFKFMWNGNSLENGVLIHEVPTDPQENSMHNGGAMVTGADLTNARLIDAILTDADFTGTITDGCKGCP